MDHQTLYLAPQAEVILLQGREQIMNLSNYGAPGQAGNNFSGDQVIDVLDSF